MFSFDKIIISLDSGELLSGIVLECTGSYIVVRCTLSKLLDKNRKVNFIIYNKVKGEVLFEGRILNSSFEYITIYNFVYIKAIQKRKETRVKVDFDLSINRISISKNKIIKLNKILPMRAKNLSSSGILLNSNLDIPKYVQLYLDIPIDNNIILCSADIVRKENNESGYFYGCKLVTVNEYETDKIRGIVFKKQLVENRIRQKARS